MNVLGQPFFLSEEPDWMNRIHAECPVCGDSFALVFGTTAFIEDGAIVLRCRNGDSVIVLSDADKWGKSPNGAGI